MRGILSASRYRRGERVGLDVKDLCTGTRVALAEKLTPTGGPSTERWHFHTGGLVWGAQVLAAGTPCDLLVIDELGPLELERGTGWANALDVLRGGNYRLALTTVRPDLAGHLQHLLSGCPMTVFRLEAPADLSAGGGAGDAREPDRRPAHWGNSDFEDGRVVQILALLQAEEG